MKRLTLLRHAKSSEDGWVIRDFDRSLNAKGRRAAWVVGRYLRDEKLAFDRVIASPAVRVVQTLEELEAGYGRALAPVWDRRLYLASADDLLDVIADMPDSVDGMLLAGHNPGLEQLALRLVPDTGSDEAREQIEIKYPTASVADIALDIPRWSDIAAGDGRLVRFTRPRDLDPELGPAYA